MKSDWKKVMHKTQNQLDVEATPSDARSVESFHPRTKLKSQSMQNYESLFSVGHTLIKQRVLESGAVDDIADRAFCDRETFKRFIHLREAISGVHWRNLISELGINVDQWLALAEAKPISSIHPKPVVGCGTKLDKKSDDHIRSVLAILIDFYDSASEKFLEGNNSEKLVATARS